MIKSRFLKVIIVSFVLILILSSCKDSPEQSSNEDASTNVTNEENTNTDTTTDEVEPAKMEEKNLTLNALLEPFIENIQFVDINDGETSIVQLADNHFKVHFSFTLQDTLRLTDWQVNIKPAFTPDFHWAPQLTPTDRH